MKKLVLDEFEVESFVTTPNSETRLGTVRGHAEGFTEGASCFFSDCDTCKLTCAETAQFSCPATCRFNCAQE